jgi:hypothetical protein
MGREGVDGLECAGGRFGRMGYLMVYLVRAAAWLELHLFRAAWSYLELSHGIPLLLLSVLPLHMLPLPLCALPCG